MTETYLPYHRRYRPKKLSQYIGNERIKKGVLSALSGENLPQVVLMSGHAGTGKTTMGRLLAKEYRCENRDALTGACGECYNCQQMDEYIETGEEGMIMNVKEIDVTGSGGKQDIDALLEDAQEPSFDGTWKVYILDECHRMTNAAQNRLLKNLEEPAERVLMILCTTDPQMLLETIISRCQYHWQVKKPSREELSGLLQRVLHNENIEYEDKALSLLCVKGDFVPRKTLTALEQVVREHKRVFYEETVEVLEAVSDSLYFDFYNILLSDDINIYRYLTFINKVKVSMELKQFVDSLIPFTVRGIYIANGIHVEALDKSEIDLYKKLFKKFSPSDVAHLLNLLLDMKGSLDIETKLLLLGYTGVMKPTMPTPQQGVAILPEDKSAVAKEKSESTNNYLESITMTKEEEEDFIEKNSQTVSATDLANMFGGTLVQGTDLPIKK